MPSPHRRWRMARPRARPAGRPAGTTLRWVPRHKNLQADALSQRASPLLPRMTMPDQALSPVSVNSPDFWRRAWLPWPPAPPTMTAPTTPATSTGSGATPRRCWHCIRRPTRWWCWPPAICTTWSTCRRTTRNAPAPRAARPAGARHARALKAFPRALDAVAHAIEAHSFSAAIPATTLEARIVQDADRLDGLGAVGLARMFYIAGRMGRALAHGRPIRWRGGAPSTTGSIRSTTFPSSWRACRG
jgi:hypothetical protein